MAEVADPTTIDYGALENGTRENRPAAVAPLLGRQRTARRCCVPGPMDWLGWGFIYQTYSVLLLGILLLATSDAAGGGGCQPQSQLTSNLKLQLYTIVACGIAETFVLWCIRHDLITTSDLSLMVFLGVPAHLVALITIPADLGFDTTIKAIGSTATIAQLPLFALCAYKICKR